MRGPRLNGHQTFPGLSLDAVGPWACARVASLIKGAAKKVKQAESK